MRYLILCRYVLPEGLPKTECPKEQRRRANLVRPFLFRGAGFGGCVSKWTCECAAEDARKDLEYAELLRVKSSLRVLGVFPLSDSQAMALIGHYEYEVVAGF
jgi:hypothetical protein